MGKTEEHGALKSLKEIIDRFAGEAIGKKVMEGSERMIEQMDDTEGMAKWVKDAMDRLDALVDERTKILIMENCGYKCAEVNSGAIDEAIAKRRKYKDVDEFLEAEHQNPMKGTRLIREGNILYQIYRPQELEVRCYCSLVRGLPADEKISLTYCHCSKGFVKKLWEAVLERPVEVELIQSVVSGAQECKFVIHL